MKNAIVDFVAQGKNLLSDEGVRLIGDSERSTIKDAAKDPEVATKLVNARDNSVDPFFRRKILLALSD